MLASGNSDEEVFERGPGVGVGVDSDNESDDSDEKEVVSLIACGLRAVPDDLAGVGPGAEKQITSVNLHGNYIQQLGGSSHVFGLLTGLVELNLSSNQIERVEGLENLSVLERLNLASNRIAQVKGLEKLWSLRVLDLSHNLITDLGGFYDHAVSESGEEESYQMLFEVKLKDNHLASVDDLLPLRNLEKLNLVELESSTHTNPLCRDATYYKDVLQILPQVKVLDPSRSGSGAGRNTSSSSYERMAGVAGARRRSELSLLHSGSAPRHTATNSRGGGHPDRIFLAQSSTQTEGDYTHVEALEKEAKTLGQQIEAMKTNFQDYDSLRSLVQNLKDQQRAQLERQEKVLRQEMEIYIQEKDIENERLRHQAERGSSANSKLNVELAEAKQVESKRVRELKRLNETHSKAVEELRTLEEFAEQLTGKIEVERALRQRAELEAQGVMKKLNASLSDFAFSSHERSQLQEKVFDMERKESSFKEMFHEMEDSLQLYCRKLAEKEKEKEALSEKMNILNESFKDTEKDLATARSEKAKLRTELEAEYSEREIMHRNKEMRKLKDLLFTWYDKMEASSNQLRKSVSSALEVNEEKLNKLFVLKNRLTSSIIRSSQIARNADKDKNEAETLLEELAKVSENLQSQLAHSHAEQSHLRKIIGQQSKQIDKYIPMSKKYHKLCLNHENLEKLYEDECSKSQRHEKQCSKLRLETARAVQEAENSKILSSEELQRAEATLKQALGQESKLQHLQDEINTLGQVINLKDTLLEDRNKSIEELGSAVKREQDDKTVIVESHSHALEQMKTTMDSLHDELNLQDQIVQQGKDQVSTLEQALQENATKSKEKDDMLQYVRSEIDSLKTMFQAREDKLREECKLFRGKSEEALRDREKADLELQKSKSEIEGLISKIKDKDRSLERTSAELDQSKQSVESVENEMRLLLKALEDERAASQMKAQRVQSVLKELAIT